MAIDKRKKSTGLDLSRDLTLLDYQHLAEFRYLLVKFLAFSKDAAHQAGLAPQQHQALLAIKGYPNAKSVTVGELAERLAVHPHSATGLVDRLVSSGLLTRSEDQSDRRRVVISLTASGEALLKSLSSIHRDEIQRIMPLLKSTLEKFETLPETQRNKV